MCGLCGAFGQKMHWSDKVDAKSNSHTSRIERMQRLKILNQYLNPKGLKVRDWQNVHFVIENFTGRAEIAEDIFALWIQVEAMLGYAFDPLEVSDGR
ncbi:MAG: hypothetical protein ACK5MJ_02840 [Alphaproteobacteria bacterium]